VKGAKESADAGTPRIRSAGSGILPHNSVAVVGESPLTQLSKSRSYGPTADEQF